MSLLAIDIGNTHVVLGLFALHTSLLQDGRPDEALAIVQEAGTLADALGDRTLQAEVAGLLAHLLSATGDYEAAVRCASITASTSGKIFATMTSMPAAVGWMPSL